MKKYKTTIEVVSDAENKDEAMEIVGEYLSGHIVSGVKMNCHTRPVHGYGKVVVAVSAVFLFITVGIISVIGLNATRNASSGLPGLDAVQVPLKTAPVIDVNSAQFKKDWHDKQISEALGRIKK